MTVRSKRNAVPESIRRGLENGALAPPSLDALTSAIEHWVRRGALRPLERWLDRELSEEGVPRHLGVPDWPRCLDLLAQAAQARPEQWPDEFDARIEGLLRSALRFSRPDGHAVFGPSAAESEPPRRAFREWAERAADLGIAAVVNRWFPSKGRTRARRAGSAPPSWSHSDRPLAVLRDNWSPMAGLLALDHRTAGAACAFEVSSLGRTWLGPTWSSEPVNADCTPAKPVRWISDSGASLAEWSFRCGERRIIRSALVLHGRQVAVLADQVEGGPPTASLRLAVPESVRVAQLADRRGVTLSAGEKVRRAQVLPLGLPSREYETDRGSLTASDGLILTQRVEGRRAWLPLLVSWNPLRQRRKADWRRLTVSEQSRICAPETAFAARISWGRDDSLIFYRSLARPALRSFLGHQTRARFLVGLFTRKGDVEPLLTVEA